MNILCGIRPKILKHFKKPSPLLWTPQGTWARSNTEKAHTFTKHRADAFQSHNSENEPEDEEALIYLLQAPYQLKPQIIS
jgi:hypothetical protein